MSGNQPDFADLFRDHHARIYRYVRYRVRDELLTEDLTAEVFERAFRNRERYDPRLAAFSTWITRIAHNVVSDHLAREATRAQHEAGPADGWDHVPSAEASPEAQILAREAVKRLLACLERLNARDREIVALRFGAEMRTKDVAALLDIKEHTVSVIVLRALERLRGCQEEP